MKLKKKLIRGSIGASIAIGLVFSTPLGAGAQQLDPGEIAGFTKEEFVAAAETQGVSPATAEAAWGDTIAMSRIPIASESIAGRPPISTSLRMAASGSYSGTCKKSWSNLFGVVVTVKTTKSWTATSTIVTSQSSRFTGTPGGTYSYDGQVGANDYYSSNGGYAHGKHVTYRQGRFTEAISGWSVNASVTFSSYPYGGYSCTYGGGL